MFSTGGKLIFTVYIRNTLLKWSNEADKISVTAGQLTVCSAMNETPGINSSLEFSEDISHGVISSFLAKLYLI